MLEKAIKKLEKRLENKYEKEVFQDPEFQEGLRHGKPRKGHPEGEVIHHIHEVLDNVDKFYKYSPLRENLRYIALIHDTFKYKVDRSKPKEGENHHGMIARRFSEKFCNESGIDEDIIELHDEAYNIWRKFDQGKNYQSRLDSLFSRIGEDIDLYSMFYRCDNATGDKDQQCFIWFLFEVIKVQQSESEI